MNEIVCLTINPFLYCSFLGFPSGSVVKNPPANAGDSCLIPELGGSPGEIATHSMDREAWRLHSICCKRTRHNLVTKQQQNHEGYWIFTKCFFCGYRVDHVCVVFFLLSGFKKGLLPVVKSDFSPNLGINIAGRGDIQLLSLSLFFWLVGWEHYY